MARRKGERAALCRERGAHLLCHTPSSSLVTERASRKPVSALRLIVSGSLASPTQPLKARKAGCALLGIVKNEPPRNIRLFSRLFVTSSLSKLYRFGLKRRFSHSIIFGVG